METSFTTTADNEGSKIQLDNNSKVEEVFGDTTSIVCSELYGFILISLCFVLLIIELVSETTPLHHYEGFFTVLFSGSIFSLFIFFVSCFFKKKTLHASNLDGLWLRVGGVGFGIGTLIYNGIEFGSWFMIPADSLCFQYLRGINPILQAIFTSSQIMLLFSKSELNIPQFKGLARFSLMHIFATNISVWIRTVLKEGIKDIAAHRGAHGEGHPGDCVTRNGQRYLTDDLIGDVAMKSTPFLYPLVIQFSMVGAVVHFGMWISLRQNERNEEMKPMRKMSTNRFLISIFKGFSLVSLINVAFVTFTGLVFIVKDPRPGLPIDFIHSFLLLISVVAALIGCIRIKKYKMHMKNESNMHIPLLKMGAVGVILYSIFCLLWGIHEDDILSKLSGVFAALISIIQVFLQLLFIQTFPRTNLPNQDHLKPMRLIVTFLLICNIALWGCLKLEVLKLEVQDSINKIGGLGYDVMIIMQKVALPLCLVFRFFSVVALADICRNCH